ncbi:MAG: M20/M25/M40 family metallo-hydrolase [Acidobacteriota bacterium]|nr:MAG: M20/M25/M40 family metallo-hydrolase [Acidobacteriota bacterium]
MRRLIHIPFIICILTVAATGQAPDGAQLEALAQKHSKPAFRILREILSIPNDAHFPEHVRMNVEWVERAFGGRGFTTRRLETGGPPLVLAERRAAGAKRTVLVYLQIDGQPVDKTKWHQADPYKPVLKRNRNGEWEEIPWERLDGQVNREWRVFARSASDAKGPVAMFLSALDIVKSEGLTPTHNLKVIMDFEEERGSPHLPEAVKRHKQALAADMLLIYDGPRHTSNRPTLDFGARGIADITLRVFGPRAPQHSGHYGNYVPNPALRLAQLLASMKDADGRVTIPGFYDGVRIDEATRAILARTPNDEPAIRQKLGIATNDRVSATLAESTQFPSLNIRGISSGWIGDQVRTIIPDSATAEIDVRLVPESDAERLISLIRNHIESQGYYLIGDREPTEEERAKYPRIASFRYGVLYGAFRTPYDSEVGKWLNQALIRTFGEPPVRIRMGGGSIPISPFVIELGIPAVAVPTVNIDNNQHSPNENLRIGNFLDGIRTFVAILTESFQKLETGHLFHQPDQPHSPGRQQDGAGEGKKEGVGAGGERSDGGIGQRDSQIRE